MEAPAVELRNVTFGWPGDPPLLHIGHFRVERGERVFLSGPSGSGKSTLLGLIGGVHRPRSGAVRVIGTAVNELSPSAADRFRGDHLGFVFQQFNLLPFLNVLDNVTLPLKFSPLRQQRLGATPANQEAGRLLSALGLTDRDLLQRRADQLSIGQQQRVAAARALIGRPALLMADEPTSALDIRAREHFLRLLMDECRQAGTTILFVSHDHTLSGLFDRSVALDAINPSPLVVG